MAFGFPDPLFIGTYGIVMSRYEPGVFGFYPFHPVIPVGDYKSWIRSMGNFAFLGDRNVIKVQVVPHVLVRWMQIQTFAGHHRRLYTTEIVQVATQFVGI
jgi:hypothetical protein